VNQNSITNSNTISPQPRLQAAIILALIADALQVVVFPLFIQGAASPADDILDLGMAAILFRLLGWHWEFLPSFLAKLVPGVDLIPCWTIAVANVYRKSKPIGMTIEGTSEEDRPR
jgi:hypothetical protein